MSETMISVVTVAQSGEAADAVRSATGWDEGGQDANGLHVWAEWVPEEQLEAYLFELADTPGVIRVLNDDGGWCTAVGWTDSVPLEEPTE